MTGHIIRVTSYDVDVFSKELRRRVKARRQSRLAILAGVAIGMGGAIIVTLGAPAAVKWIAGLAAMQVL